MAPGKTPAPRMGPGSVVWGEGLHRGPRGCAEGPVLCWVLGGAAGTGLTSGGPEPWPWGSALPDAQVTGRAGPSPAAVPSWRWDVIALGYSVVPVDEKQAQRTEVTCPRPPGLSVRVLRGGQLEEGLVAQVQFGL